MSYGHAQRNLATIEQLNLDTAELLRAREDLTEEQKRWIAEVNARSGDRQVDRLAG